MLSFFNLPFLFISPNIGAPDPTAGASVEDVAAWYLDEAGVREQLRSELANLASNGSAFGPAFTGFNGPGGPNTVRSAAGGGRSTPIVTSVANMHPGGGGLPQLSTVVSGTAYHTTAPCLASRSSSDLGQFGISRSGVLGPDADATQSNEASEFTHSSSVFSVLDCLHVYSSSPQSFYRTLLNSDLIKRRFTNSFGAFPGIQQVILVYFLSLHHFTSHDDDCHST